MVPSKAPKILRRWRIMFKYQRASRPGPIGWSGGIEGLGARSIGLEGKRCRTKFKLPGGHGSWVHLWRGADKKDASLGKSFENRESEG